MKKNITITTLITALAAAASGAFAQGTFTLGKPQTTNCPAGFTCNAFTVSAPGIPNTGGRYALKRGATGSKGLILFFSGSGGGKWWAVTDISFALLDQFVALDYDVVMASWPSGWIHAPLGSNLGSHLLAQRPDTVIEYAATSLKRGGRMIAVGSSNGSSQIAYSLALYGAGAFIDRAIIVSGPPFMEQCAACSGADPNLEFSEGEKGFIDATFGYGALSGPCYQKLADWCDWEAQQSVDSGGVYAYPATSVAILLGNNDDYKIRARGSAYFDLLNNAGQYPNGLSIQYVLKTGHSFQHSQVGCDAIYSAVTQ